MISPGLFIPPADNPCAMLQPQPDPAALFSKASPEFLACLAAGVEMRSRLEGSTFIIETVPKCAIADLGDGRKKVFIKYEQPAGSAPA